MSEYKMPKLGADMEDAILVEWKVKEGDFVKKGDIIAEIETVKGDIDVEVFEDGIIEKLVAQPGESIPVGTVLAYINSNGQLSSDEKPEKMPSMEESAPIKVLVEVPPIQESTPPPSSTEIPTVEEPTTVIPKPVESEVEQAIIPKEIPIEKPSSEETLAVKEPKVTPLQEEVTPLRRPMPPKSQRPMFRHNASPLARRMAEELGIDLQQVKGTGEGGIIHKIDVERYLAPRKKEEKLIPSIKEKTKVGKDRNAKIRSAIAAAMSKSNREIPHYYLETTIDMSRALNWLRKKNEPRLVKERLLAAVLLLKASALALRKVPALNAYWLENKLAKQSGIHIGFAISLRSGGLVIPAIHDIDKKSLDELMENLNDVTQRARGGKLRSSELTDGTVTITSLGDRGVEKVFGVIYPPQVALIGFGRIQEKPWAENGLLGVRPQLTVTLAADHRATDGRIGGKFLNALNLYLQEPEKL